LPLDDIMAPSFKGDGTEDPAKLLHDIELHVVLNPTEEVKLNCFRLCLESGSYAQRWYNDLPAAEKDTFEHLVTAFRKKWLEKEKGELQEELLSLVLRPEDVGVPNEDGMLGHVRWAVKVAGLAARIEDDGSLIPQALKNIPVLLSRYLGSNCATWPDLVQKMKKVPSTVTESFLASYYDDEAAATIFRWHNRPIPQLPELFYLSSFLEMPLPKDQKIPIPDKHLDKLVVRDYVCTEDDVRLLFRGGGGFNRLAPFYFTILSATPDANTEAGFISFWDKNIRELLDILLPDGRCSRSSQGTKTAAFRPDFAFIYRNMCLFRGEEKPPLSLDDPKAKLADKLPEPWPYRDAPYVLGYHAKGPILTLAAIHPTENGRTTVTDLARYDLRRRRDRIRHMVALINAEPLFRGLADLASAVDPELTEIESYTCIIEILGPVQTRMKHLQKMYAYLEEKKVPHTDAMLHFIPENDKVILQPRGDARGPKTVDELLDAVICVLEMLEVLHKPPTVIHRDLRWPNIMNSLKNRREWFVIDWTDPVEAPARAANKRDFNPRTHCPALYLDNHGTEVDLWSVGELMLTSKVREITPQLTRLGRSLKEKLTATEALQQIRNFRSSLQDTGDSAQQDASSVLTGVKRKAREDCEESVATKRVNQ
ncbi:hypothetical protein GGX14DRAFT_464373, partial [Mycena pura]